MNVFHRWYCKSNGWAEVVQKSMLPGVLANVDLGDNALEIGPGPGVTTDGLKELVTALTAIEIDHKLASSLKQRLAGTNVTVVEGDATAMPFPDATFTGAVSFTMLHHVPTVQLQDRLLSETARVLKPGAIFTGSDSRPSLRWRIYHIMDTCTPVDPATFQSRLEKAGFTDVRVDAHKGRFTFAARRA